jgi:NADH-quinone oxidoreductase subunit L
MNAHLYLWLIPLLPFAGFLLNGILGRRLPKWLVTTVALLAPLAAFGVVLNAALGVFGIIPVTIISLPFTETCPLPWINAGLLHVNFSFVLDQLSLVMLLVVTGVGFLIHVYSVGYMGDDKGYARYFSYLNLFLFFMTVPGAGRKRLGHVHRMGRRGPGVVPTHRLLVPEEVGGRRG